jgi:predicted transcriptional regulator
LVRQREKGNLSRPQITILILSYLYDKEKGENAHTIQLFAIRGHTQESKRFKDLLEELCKKQLIRQEDMSHVSKGHVVYIETDKGKKIIERLRDPLLKEFFELGEI